MYLFFKIVDCFTTLKQICKFDYFTYSACREKTQTCRGGRGPDVPAPRS